MISGTGCVRPAQKVPRPELDRRGVRAGHHQHQATLAAAQGLGLVLDNPKERADEGD